MIAVGDSLHSRSDCEPAPTDGLKQPRRNQVLNKPIGRRLRQAGMRANIRDRGLFLLADNFKDEGQAFKVHEFSIYDKEMFVI